MLTAVTGIAGLIFLGWLVFTLAVNALPFFVALSVGKLAFDSGAGAIGAIVISMTAAVVTLIAGRSFVMSRSKAVRSVALAVFAVPAAAAGYHVTYGILGLGETAEAWRLGLGVAGALVTTAVAFRRMSSMEAGT